MVSLRGGKAIVSTKQHAPSKAVTPAAKAATPSAGRAVHPPATASPKAPAPRVPSTSVRDQDVAQLAKLTVANFQEVSDERDELVRQNKAYAKTVENMTDKIKRLERELAAERSEKALEQIQNRKEARLLQRQSKLLKRADGPSRLDSPDARGAHAEDEDATQAQSKKRPSRGNAASKHEQPTHSKRARYDEQQQQQQQEEEEEALESLDEDDGAASEERSPSDEEAEDLVEQPERWARPPAMGGGPRPKTRGRASASTVGQEAEQPQAGGEEEDLQAVPRGRFLKSIPRQDPGAVAPCQPLRVLFSREEKVSLVLGVIKHTASWVKIVADPTLKFHEKRTDGSLKDLHRCLVRDIYGGDKEALAADIGAVHLKAVLNQLKQTI